MRQAEKPSKTKTAAGLFDTRTDSSRLHPALRGLTFQQIPGDGHCLFHAVGLYTGQDVQSLRDIVATNMTDHRAEYMAFAGCREEQFRAHIDAIRNTNEWGDHLEIHILQQVLMRPLIIIRSNENPILPENVDAYTGDPIFVFYNGHNHYDAFLSAIHASTGREILTRIQEAVNNGERVTYRPGIKKLERGRKGKRVNNPPRASTRSGGKSPPFDLEAVIAKSERIADYAKREAANRDLVLILGNTGAGKSTFVNYLAGCEMYEEKVSGSLHKGVLARDPIMEIGHGFDSLTEYPQIYTDEQSGLSYCDCPGFLDNRGPEFDICNAYAIKTIVSQARSVKAVVVLINYNSLLADRGRGVRETLHILQQLLGTQASDIVSFKESIAILISKAHQKRRVTLDRLKKYLSGMNSTKARETEDSLFHALSDQIGFYDPLDRDTVLQRGGCSRGDMIETLIESPGIEEDQYLFRFAIGAESKVALYAFVNYLEDNIRAAFENKAFSQANRELMALQRLQILDYQFIGEAFYQRCEMVRDLIRSYESQDDALETLAQLKEQMPYFETDIDLTMAVIRARLEERAAQEEAIRAAKEATETAEIDKGAAEERTRMASEEYDKAQALAKLEDQKAAAYREEIKEKERKILLEKQRLQQQRATHHHHGKKGRCAIQ